MKLSEIAKRMVTIIGISFLGLIVIGIIYYRSFSVFPFILGAFLGSLLNVLKIILLERTVGKAVNMEKKNAGNYVRFQFFLRFLLTGLVLVLAVFCPFINVWGAVAGIFTFQVAALGMKHFFGKDI